MLEVLGSVVSLAELDVQVRTVDLDLDMTILAVTHGVVAGIAQDVIDRSVALHAIKHLAEIVGVEEGLAAGVAGKSSQGLLAGEVRVKLVLYGSSTVYGGAAQACRSGGTTGRRSFQTAGIHGVNCDVGFDGRVHRGAQSGLVLHAGLRHAAAEVNDRLLLVELGQHLTQRLQRL